LKEVRTMRNMTTRQLGYMSRLSHSYLSALELGKRQPTMDTVLRLAQALEFPVTNLWRQVQVDREKAEWEQLAKLDRASKV
jgi:transcriptional regulator with XRE-family HTH domain